MPGELNAINYYVLCTDEFNQDEFISRFLSYWKQNNNAQSPFQPLFAAIFWWWRNNTQSPKSVFLSFLARFRRMPISIQSNLIQPLTQILMNCSQHLINRILIKNSELFRLFRHFFEEFIRTKRRSYYSPINNSITLGYSKNTDNSCALNERDSLFMSNVCGKIMQWVDCHARTRWMRTIFRMTMSSKNLDHSVVRLFAINQFLPRVLTPWYTEHSPNI